MLGKLLKQEFRATGRIMLPVLGALIILSILGNFSINLMDRGITSNMILRILFGLLIAAFIIGIFGVMLVTLLLMVTRFYRNLLKDEGYLMHTLPVSVHGLVWSKMIVSLVWFIVSGLVIALILFLTALFQSGHSLADISVYFPSWTQIKAVLSRTGVLSNLITLGVLFVLVFLLGFFTGCLHFYAAMAMGHMFNRDKILLSIVFYVALSIVLTMMTGLLGAHRIELMNPGEIETLLESMVFLRKVLISGLFIELLQATLLYFATTLSLRRGLNLA